MTTVADPFSVAVELADVAGLDLTDRQRNSLAALLATGSDGRWGAHYAAVDPESDAVLHARALVGLLVLDERIVWAARARFTARLAFARFVDLLDRVRTADENLADLKVYRANGDERVERSDTAGRVRFITHRTCRGWTWDTAIVQDAALWTPPQLDDLMPGMVSSPNPQLIRA